MQTTIKKHSPFWVKHLRLISGVAFIISGIGNLIETEHPVSIFMFTMFMFGGFINLLVYLYYPKEVMISWDDEKLEVKGQQLKSKSFLFKDIVDFRFEKDKLILKSDAHRGSILNIKGFKDEDLQVLRSRLALN
ncbi:hypothetical protein INR75_17800 [Zunongwangia sp. SCSIO 43204]|uniref:hypothetical protein n=1 Tax=Zunongwangia sp. SCSIO 43204 TaxID=2779359 RepID=UPI001CA80245|nr:hypothetical protein [Zunongwangia sp. SCSIO 43204]UAB84000.1 hypothetical protein INR75_17800 [Zunongwangia sp. SCSIO 43204]